MLLRKKETTTEHDKRVLAACRAIEALKLDGISPTEAAKHLWRMLSAKLLGKVLDIPSFKEPNRKLGKVIPITAKMRKSRFMREKRPV